MDAFPTQIEDVLLSRSPRSMSDVASFRETFAGQSGWTCQPQLVCPSIGSHPGDLSTERPTSGEFDLQRAIRCQEGQAFVLIWDVRDASRTQGRWLGFHLAADDDRTLLIPPGVAVGWQITSLTGTLEVGFSTDPAAANWDSLPWDEPAVADLWPLYPTSFSEQSRGHVSRRRPAKRRGSHTRQFTPSKLNRRTNKTPRRSEKAIVSGELDRSMRSTSSKTPRATVKTPAQHVAQRPILVLGSDTPLGVDLVRHLRTLGTVYGGCSQPEPGVLHPIPLKVDVRRPASLRQAIRKLRPSLIVNASTLNDVAQAEAEPRIAQGLNASAPAVIAQEAMDVAAGFIHFTSDLVFDGQQERPHRESDAPRPASQLARTHLVGCQEIQSSGVDSMILRAGWLYSTRGNDFVKQIIDLLTYRNSITLPADHFGSPTSTDWIARTLTELLQRAQGNYSKWLQEHGGIYHLSMLGFASRIEVADTIVACCKDFGLPVTLNRIQGMAMAQLPSATPTQANCRLDPTLLATTFDLKLPRWQEELKRTVAQILGERIPLKQVA